MYRKEFKNLFSKVEMSLKKVPIKHISVQSNHIL